MEQKKNGIEASPDNGNELHRVLRRRLQVSETPTAELPPSPGRHSTSTPVQARYSQARYAEQQRSEGLTSRAAWMSNFFLRGSQRPSRMSDPGRPMEIPKEIQTTGTPTSNGSTPSSASMPREPASQARAWMSPRLDPAGHTSGGQSRGSDVVGAYEWGRRVDLAAVNEKNRALSSRVAEMNEHLKNGPLSPNRPDADQIKQLTEKVNYLIVANEELQLAKLQSQETLDLLAEERQKNGDELENSHRDRNHLAAELENVKRDNARLQEESGQFQFAATTMVRDRPDGDSTAESKAAGCKMVLENAELTANMAQMEAELRQLREAAAAARLRSEGVDERERQKRTAVWCGREPGAVSIKEHRVSIEGDNAAVGTPEVSILDGSSSSENAAAPDGDDTEDRRAELAAMEAERNSAEAAQASAESGAAKLEVERDRLRDELAAALGAKERAEAALLTSQASTSASLPPIIQADSAESQLKAVLSTPGTTSEQLKQAIGGVTALLDEAKRELAAKEFRERRAAYEELHGALGGDNEDRLEEAIKRARDTNIDEDEILKAEIKLTNLKSMTDEERAARERKKRESSWKKELFQVVKSDNVEKMSTLIAEIEAAGVQWKEWRDYAGRNLYRCSEQLRATSLQDYLAPIMGVKMPQKVERKRSSLNDFDRQSSQQSGSKEATRIPSKSSPVVEDKERKTSDDWYGGSAPSTARVSLAVAPAEGQSTMTPRAASQAIASSTAHASGVARPVAPEVTLTEEQEETFKKTAMRAVVQDDAAALWEVLEQVPVSIWSRWQNKAKKDLITLCEERGSSNAESVLMKAQGIVKEMERDTYEEREAVWIYLPGEVQPRPATVLEDTPAEADDVLIEYWDGYDEPERIERCMVRKREST